MLKSITDFFIWIIKMCILGAVVVWTVTFGAICAGIIYGAKWAVAKVREVRKNAD